MAHVLAHTYTHVCGVYDRIVPKLSNIQLMRHPSQTIVGHLPQSAVTHHFIVTLWRHSSRYTQFSIIQSAMERWRDLQPETNRWKMQKLWFGKRMKEYGWFCILRDECCVMRVDYRQCNDRARAQGTCSECVANVYHRKRGWHTIRTQDITHPLAHSINSLEKCIGSGFSGN